MFCACNPIRSGRSMYNTFQLFEVRNVEMVLFLCHQDVGQMDMYVRMYDEMMCPQGHNPTIGLILCADTDDDVAHYSVLNGSDQLFAAKYLTYMPKREDLRREIEQQKEFYRLQQKGKIKGSIDG